MERQNAELYRENYRIMLENERLRTKAVQVNKENQALHSQLKQRRIGAGGNINLPELELDPNAGPSTSGNQMNPNNPGGANQI